MRVATCRSRVPLRRDVVLSESGYHPAFSPVAESSQGSLRRRPRFDPFESAGAGAYITFVYYRLLGK